MPYTCKACGTYSPGPSEVGYCPQPTCQTTKRNVEAADAPAPPPAVQSDPMRLLGMQSAELVMAARFVERAVIIEWLRNLDDAPSLLTLAEALERGEHVKVPR